MKFSQLFIKSKVSIGKAFRAVAVASLLAATVSSCSAPASTAKEADTYKADQSIFADSFQRGWVDFSWAERDVKNATPVHGGKFSIRVGHLDNSAKSNAFAGIWFSHSALDSRLFRSLSFWAHGGATGGQKLAVTAMVGTEWQPKVVFPPLEPNQWKQITVPLSELGVSGQANFTGLLIGNDGTNAPAFYLDDVQLHSVSPPAVVTINVDTATTLQKVDERLFGINTGIWEVDFASKVPLLKQMDNRALRFPGGLAAEVYHWASNTSTDKDGKTTNWDWGLNFDQFAAGALESKAQAFITVNYSTGTPEEAAEWVKYSNLTKKYGFKYWEVGNESYAVEFDKQARFRDPYIYATRAKDYIAQMKAVDPTIKVGIVIVGNETSNDGGYTDHPATNPRTGKTSNGWDPVVLSTLKKLGVTPDFVVYHRYIYPGGQEDDTSLLLSSRAWHTEMASIRQMLVDYLGDSASKVDIMVTEHNSTVSIPGKQTNSLVNGLFLADSLAYAAQTELKALVWWVLSDEPQNPSDRPDLYGWRNYGGFGIMHRVSAKDPKFEVYPTFYIFKLLKHFARGGDSIVKADTNYPLLAAHAARRTDGSLSLLVINKNPSTTYKAGVSLKGYAPDPKATVYSYGIPQDEAARTKAGSPDIAQDTIADAGTSFVYSFPPYSATVISLSPVGSPAKTGNAPKP